MVSPPKFPRPRLPTLNPPKFDKPVRGLLNAVAKLLALPVISRPLDRPLKLPGKLAKAEEMPLYPFCIKFSAPEAKFFRLPSMLFSSEVSPLEANDPMESIDTLPRLPRLAQAAVADVPKAVPLLTNAPMALFTAKLAELYKEVAAPFSDPSAPEPMVAKLVIGVLNSPARAVPANAAAITGETDKLAPVAILKADTACKPLSVYTWPCTAVTAGSATGEITPAAFNPS